MINNHQISIIVDHLVNRKIDVTPLTITESINQMANNLKKIKF